MLKRRIICFAGLVVLISLGGCVSVIRKQDNREVQGLKNQVTALHQQIQYKDEEINSLKAANTATVSDRSNFAGSDEKLNITEVKSRPNARQIQICLKNGGYDPGVVDGKMGKQTRMAIKAFQKDNNLKVDGKVGKQTWKLLGKYLK